MAQQIHVLQTGENVLGSCEGLLVDAGIDHEKCICLFEFLLCRDEFTVESLVMSLAKLLCKASLIKAGN